MAIMSVSLNRENAWENADCRSSTARLNRTLGDRSFANGSITSFEGPSGGVLGVIGRDLGGSASTGLEHLGCSELVRDGRERFKGKDLEL